MSIKTLATFLAASTFVVASQAPAVTTWTFTAAVANTTIGNNTNGSCGDPLDATSATTLRLASAGGTTCVGTGGAIVPNATINAQGISNTNNAMGTTGGDTGTSINTNSGGVANHKIESTSIITVYGTSGIGVKNRDACTTTGCNGDYNEGNSPEHAIDNNQRTDMVLLTFSSQVALTKVTAGWTQNDSDISVLAYTPTSASNNGVTSDATIQSSLIGKTYSTGSGGILGSGWSVIGNYGDIGTATAGINSSNLYSSAWLIGAYNPLFGTCGSCSAGTTTQSNTGGNDFFKLQSVAGCTAGDTASPGCIPPPPNQTPEPGSLALIGLAMVGMVSLRRRQKR